MDRPIGIFDSGIGGLTVLKRLTELLPNEDYLYFGDTARVPYGEKTPQQLIQFVKDILNWYKSKRTKAVLMACNTSSAVVLDIIKNQYDFPIFGLIQPTAQYIAGLDVKNIGLIATSATVKSKAYSKAVLKLDNSKQVFDVACPGLVEIVESGNINTQESLDLVTRYVKPLLDNNVEKIILGCTHYPYLAPVINKITNNPDMLIDPAEYIVMAAKEKLLGQGLLNSSSEGSRNYFVSANPEKFTEVGNKFFSDCTNAEKIDLSLLKL